MPVVSEVATGSVSAKSVLDGALCDVAFLVLERPQNWDDLDSYGERCVEPADAGDRGAFVFPTERASAIIRKEQNEDVSIG